MGNNSNMKINDDEYLDSMTKYRDIGQRADDLVVKYISEVETCLPNLPAEVALQLQLLKESFLSSVGGNYNFLLPEQAVQIGNYGAAINDADQSLYGW